jgi:1,6-anhydro-N-acetylmuramate kinase
MTEISKVIGLMSGTSLDGVDAALIETDGEDVARPLGSLTIPYGPGTRALLRAALEEARGVAQGAPVENLDDTVGKRFPAALDRLEKAGARLSHESLPLIDDMMKLLSRTSILVAEAYQIHRDRLARRAAFFEDALPPLFD